VSEDSDRDLSAAFDELRAPSSTANYATRSPGFDVPSATRSRNWPQAVAAVTAVALALAGAGTFLALRSARQGGTPSRSGANPPARSGAAMAYDSSAGVTVMYGGADGSGKPLTDAWTWNGSDWMAAPKGPGPLVDVHMVDDPAAAGVLLVGMPAPKLTGGSGGGACVSVGGGGGGFGGAVSVRNTPPPSGGCVPVVVVIPSGDVMLAVSRAIGFPNWSTPGSAGACGLCSGQGILGSVPLLNASFTRVLPGQNGVNKPPLVSSTCANEIPFGTPKSTSGCVPVAAIM